MIKTWKWRYIVNLYRYCLKFSYSSFWKKNTWFIESAKLPNDKEYDKSSDWYKHSEKNYNSQDFFTFSMWIPSQKRLILYQNNLGLRFFLHCADFLSFVDCVCFKIQLRKNCEVVMLLNWKSLQRGASNVWLESNHKLILPCPIIIIN